MPSLDEYYLHLFDVTQADLNWDNEELRKEIYKVVNFWIEKGVKGFRLDVINLISKPEIFKDDNSGDGRKYYTDGPNIHKYLKELNENTFGKYDDIITVGEMSSTSIYNCIKYSNPRENELSMVFNFHHSYIYQGEEFGMTNPGYDSIDEYGDVESINYYNILKSQGETEENILKILSSKSRDNSRTPVQWDDSENAGFTSGEPWLNVSKNYKIINAKKSLEDKSLKNIVLRPYESIVYKIN